ncbi:GNAT family N-acetyltransferase [Stenotrophomonas sp. S48]|uniref:GNAT family N-acetyltransferase n=1 Tax=unclassified Stenotrophomonas TaxID=196198 RepID=UPI0018FF1266|nr:MULTISPECIES: GNAT family protein [unclassified Stenotrophomonas]MBK0028138.1 GNAT family N-acetyltransferase [Stenotrophomonas sp. S48]MBK0049978.1 GNAT family N-acetyltransferase [Stenotrophomonas sp. S49]
MCTEPLPSPIPALHPVLRRHLLHLSHGGVIVRPLHRNDLNEWLGLCVTRRARHGFSCRPDADVQLLIGVQRSRLQFDNDQLLLGVFDASSRRLVDQLGVRLQSTQARSAELHPLCQGPWRGAERLRDTLHALCPFLFEQVGLHRLYVLLPARTPAAIASAWTEAGFAHEGVLRGQHFDGQHWQDRHLHALTAPEWRRRQDELG